MSILNANDFMPANANGAAFTSGLAHRARTRTNVGPLALKRLIGGLRRAFSACLPDNPIAWGVAPGCHDSAPLAPNRGALKRWAIISFPTASAVAAQQNFHEIAPPVDYSFIPTWAIFLASFVGLSLIGLIVWWLKRKPKPGLPPKLPREIALEELDRISGEIETMNPYQFSIRVSDILRRYVTNQFALPVTRQTSVEFLTALAKSSPFSTNEKSLLEDFLNRCDLIKFARYDATAADSRLLLEEATRFVKGEQLAFA